MADITFRLPGREQYSYVEVTFTSEEYTDPGPYPIADLLQQTLADLNATFPEAASSGDNNQGSSVVGSPQGGGSQPVSSNGAPSCIHGVRVHKTGTSARGAWQAWMCPSRDRNNQCKPEWVN